MRQVGGGEERRASGTPALSPAHPPHPGKITWVVLLEVIYHCVVPCCLLPDTRAGRKKAAASPKDARGSARMSSIGTGYDQSTTTYSPDGRVFQIEYAAKAVDNSGTAVGIRCKDGVVMGVEKPKLSKMLVEGSNRRIFTVDKHSGMCVSGLMADARQVVSYAREEANSYQDFYGGVIPGNVLCDRVASLMHIYTLNWCAPSRPHPTPTPPPPPSPARSLSSSPVVTLPLGPPSPQASAPVWRQRPARLVHRGRAAALLDRHERRVGALLRHGDGQGAP